MLKRLAMAVAAVLVLPGLAEAQILSRDRQLFDKVVESVLTYSRFTIFDQVSASVDDGVVTLAGKVTQPFKATDIAARVSRVPGVRQVRNELAVLPVSILDDELRFVIARRIYRDPAFWTYATMANPPIHIIIENGHVTLTGVVNNEVERMMARSLVSGTFGVFSVTNDLKTDAEMKTLLGNGPYPDQSHAA